MTAGDFEAEETACYTIGDGIAYVESVDKALLLDVTKGSTISQLTDSALQIWRHALVLNTFEDVLEAVSSHYQLPAPSIERHCRTFLDQLVAQGMLCQRSADR